MDLIKIDNNINTIHFSILENVFEGVLNNYLNNYNANEFCFFNYINKNRLETIILEFFKDLLVKSNVIQFSINDFENLMLFLSKIDYLNNNIKNKYKNFYTIVNNKMFRLISKFDLFNFVSLLRISVEMLSISSIIRNKHLDVSKTKLIYQYNNFHQLNLLLSFGSLGLIQIKLKIYKKSLDLDISYTFEQTNKLLNKKIFLLKQALIKHGFFLKRINIKKNDFV